MIYRRCCPHQVCIVYIVEYIANGHPDDGDGDDDDDDEEFDDAGEVTLAGGERGGV